MSIFHRLFDLCREGSPPGRRAAGQPTEWLALLLAIVVGSALYGATIGLWRAPLQAVYTAAKFPLLILLVTLCNAFLNGLLARLTGADLSMRESAFLVTASFAVFSLIAASLSPVSLFFLLNTPPLNAGESVLSHNMILLLHVTIIAFAGIMGNLRLYRGLTNWQVPRATARRILVCWLAGNLFLGCQLSWIMRPFIGSPGLAVEFLRPDAFNGNFYESIGTALARVFSS
jgi:hypothetical protein